MKPSSVRPKTHALLVGIDAYGAGVEALTGCVNDIDAIEALLVERLKVSPEGITRLTAPPKEGTDGAAPTRANLLAAFEALGGADVAEGDRVFIYFSGHGTTVPVRDGEYFTAREALVPVDVSVADGVASNLLYDVELNRVLGRIAQTGAWVTVVLDCCHSGGATRDALADAREKVRALRLDTAVPLASLGLAAEPGAAATTRGLDPPVAPASGSPGRSVADVQIVAACLSDELARECPDSRGGPSHGLLTRTLLDVLGRIEDASLPALPWGRIWRELVTTVQGRRPQHPSLTGGYARPVFGGPDGGGDVGFGVTLRRNVYTLDVGTLAGVSAGAEVAVYGSEPARFPPIDSDAHRVGLLTVKSAERTSADARVKGSEVPFALPEGARARLVTPGEPDRLSFAVVPDDEALEGEIAGSPLLRPAVGERPGVSVVRRADGDLAITDDLHGTGESPGEPFLAIVPAGQRDRTRAVLEQYVRYSAPMRMRTMCTDLPGALRIEYLDCASAGPDPSNPKRALMGGSDPGAGARVIAAGTDGIHDFAHRQLVAIRVVNTAGTETLHVTLLLCAADGSVAIIDTTTLAERTGHVFWFERTVGRPFRLKVDAGRSVQLDRLVAIGTTEPDKPLGHLVTPEGQTFASALVAQREAFPAAPAAPPKLWTATHLTARIRTAPIRRP